jgi:hypothetical protein
MGFRPSPHAMPCAPRAAVRRCAMCNLYSITKGQQAIRDLAGAMRDLTGNLPMLPGVFPDYSAPIRPHRGGRRARTRHGALGHAVADLRHRRQEDRSWRHQHPQRQIAPLAAMARRRKSLHRPLYQLR